MIKFLKITFLTVFVSNVLAQSQPHCGADEFTEVLVNNNPEIALKYAQTDQYLAQFAATDNLAEKKNGQAVVYTIPVVFHIIYDTDYDNINKSQILDGLQVLNEDFRRQNNDKVDTRSIFQSVATDMEVEFKLAKTDPNGNCTDGINRIQSSLSVNADDNVKDLIQWDNTRYMNVWVVNSINSSSSSGTILGYAYRPFQGQQYKQDGILIRHDRLGTIGTSVSLGRTLTHETGHYLGLKHPFTDGCNSGDQIADTPPVASASFGCNLNKNSCSNDSPDLPDMIENFMDYADDECTNLFTAGQKSYVQGTLQTTGLRKELHLTSNLVATGIINPPACQPDAKFSYSAISICSGDTIQFTDETEDGDPDVYQWTFPGGSPSVSSDQDPSVYYPNGGEYDVTLKVTNAAGTSTYTVTKLVQVKMFYTSYNAQWIEGFEAPELNIPDVTTLSTYDEISFDISNEAASAGSQSLKLDNYNANVSGEIDEFISPNIWTLFGTSLNMSFDYAFAHKSASNSDVLKVMVSTDCGRTWVLRRLYAGSILRTVSGPVSGPFIPGQGEWKSSTVNFDIYEGTDPILIKFQFQNGGGNNLYIDNINFSANNVGLEERLVQNLEIYPNPTSDRVNISFGEILQDNIEISIKDLSGRTVLNKAIKVESDHIVLDHLSLSKGAYILTLEGGNIHYSTKLMID